MALEHISTIVDRVMEDIKGRQVQIGDHITLRVRAGGEGSRMKFKMVSGEIISITAKNFVVDNGKYRQSFLIRDLDGKNIKIIEEESEGTDMSRGADDLRARFTMEQYLERKRAGQTDKAIVKEVKTYLMALNELKKEWGIVGTGLPPKLPPNFGQMLPPEEPPAAMQPEFVIAPEIEPQPVMLEEPPSVPVMDILPEIEWLKPKSSRQEPIPFFSLNQKRMMLSAQAMKEMGRPRYIRIGLSASTGEIYIVPLLEISIDGFAVKQYKPSEKGASGYFGWGLVAKRVIASGFAPAKFSLTRDEVNGWWVAKVDRVVA